MVRRASYVTKIGSTIDGASSGNDVVISMEPEVGATLRTKGRFYFLCEVTPADPAAGRIAHEVAELARDEYYYDLSAGIEMSLRRALRHANRRAAQRLRDQRGRALLHCACAVIVGNELYGVRIGAAQLFVVRRARLFLPGDEPGELADFVHRTTTRQAASLGSDVDVLPGVWRQTLEPGDTLILASGALIEGLGAETLKNAAVTLHPRAAAQQVHDRFANEGLAGSDAALFVEISLVAEVAAAPARSGPPAIEPREAPMAAQQPAGTDNTNARRGRPAPTLAAAGAPAVAATQRGSPADLQLAPRPGLTLPRLSHNARERMRRRQRVTTALAIVLLVVASAVGVVAYRDFTSSRAISDFQVAIGSARDEFASAQRLADRKPADPDAVRQRLAAATARLDDAARSPAADAGAIADLRAQVTALDDRLSSVIIDLGRTVPGAAPRQLTATPNGLYAADPGAGRLWRVFGEPAAARTVLQKGSGSIAAVVAVIAQENALLAIDESRKVWKAEGNTVVDVTPDGTDRWRQVTSAATFVGNLYVLDGQAGQLWKSEGSDRGFGAPIGFLAAALQPNTARSVAVDGFVWIVTTGGEILKYQRSPQGTAVRVDFVPRWQSDPVRPSAIQSLDGQNFIYLMDGPGRRVVQMTRDGREIARFDLPASLEDARAFFVSEGQHVAYSVHGSKIAVTDISR